MLPSLIRRYRDPIIFYLLLLILVASLQLFFDWGIVLSLSATYMLVVPIYFGRDDKLLSVKPRQFLKGLIITIGILSAYILCYKLFAVFTNKELGLRDFTYSFIAVQFLLVALPEELFFRGYLQKELGNNIKAIVLVSFLFGIAHLTTICLFGGAGFNTCAQNGLTFFPSLVMGYLYYSTGTIWSSIVFHFFANIVHILITLN